LIRKIKRLEKIKTTLNFRLEDNGFSLDRINGSHHIFIHPVIETPINAQKKKDGTAKAYQIKQAINIIDGE
jgi:predicted RNA binding protein YcfA (HicA-like mRNA interferase family)